MGEPVSLNALSPQELVQVPAGAAAAAANVDWPPVMPCGHP